MPDSLRSAKDAAAALGISVLTFYDWLSQSDDGRFLVRGQSFAISYFQGGGRGQGRIRIEAAEIERLKDAMRVTPHAHPHRERTRLPQQFPGITVVLGRPSN